MLSLPSYNLRPGMNIILLCTITFVYLPAVSIAQTGQTTVSLSTQTNPVGVGDTVTLECQIRDPPSNYAVTFLRRTAASTDRVTWAGTILEGFKDRMVLTERSQDVNSRESLLTIYDVVADDDGTYTCEVYDADASTSEAVAELKLQVQQQEDPQVAIPSCTSNPDLSQPILEGSRIDLFCQTTDSTIPRVHPEWSNAFGKIPGQDTYRDNGVTTTTLSRTATLEDDAALFICSIKSLASPEKEGQQCYVGPLVVNRNPEQPEPPAYTKKPGSGETTDKVQIVKGGKTKKVIEKCMAFCSALVDLE